MQKTLINILGTSRSGTTMLDLIMGNDNQSFSMGEVYALFRPHRPHHFSIDCNCGNPQCPYWMKIIQLKEKDLFVKSFEILDVRYIIDSSKDLPWVMDSCHALRNKKNISIINFLLYKPILNYCYSFWKRNYTIKEAIHQFKVYYTRFFEAGLNAYTVDFKELVHYPDSTIELLCEITGQAYTSDRKRFWEKEHHHLFGSAGTRKQARQGNSSIRPKEEFSEEFKSLIPQIQQIIEKDKELTILLNKLNELDYKNRRKESEQNQFLFSRIKPIWYYYNKGKKKWRSVFPDKSLIKQ